MRTPPGVEVRSRRQPDGRRLYFIVNHGAATNSLQLPWPAFDHLAGRSVSGDLTLEPYQVAILTANNQGQ